MKLRAGLEGQHAYGAPQLDVPVRLNVNENPFGPSPELVEAIAAAVADAARDLNRYPERDAVALRAALADYVARESGASVSAANVWPANGSNEVMHHLLLAFGGPGRRLVTFSPSYSMYSEYCRDTYTEFASVPRNPDFTVDRACVDAALALAPDIVVLCSPNNPTGTVTDPDVIDYLASRFDGLLIVDEAYGEFRPVGTPSAVLTHGMRPGIVVLRTMSKAFSCAGLRLGYAIADEATVDACRLVRLPYHLSAITQAAAIAAVGFADELTGKVALLRGERDALANWLRNRGNEVAASGANFLLFKTFGERHAVWERLVERGVLIRETGPDGWLRVSIGTPDENIAFREALMEGDV